MGTNIDDRSHTIISDDDEDEDDVYELKVVSFEYNLAILGIFLCESDNFVPFLNWHDNSIILTLYVLL